MVKGWGVGGAVGGWGRRVASPAFPETEVTSGSHGGTWARGAARKQSRRWPSRRERVQQYFLSTKKSPWPGPTPWAHIRYTTHACIVVVAVWKLKRFSLGNQVRMGVSSARQKWQGWLGAS